MPQSTPCVVETLSYSLIKNIPQDSTNYQNSDTQVLTLKQKNSTHVLTI